jgi:hypothetical protein
MRTNPGLDLIGKLISGLLGPKHRPPVETDVDFRRLPERPDVVGGWERRPHVPGARHDEVR